MAGLKYYQKYEGIFQIKMNNPKADKLPNGSIAFENILFMRVLELAMILIGSKIKGLIMIIIIQEVIINVSKYIRKYIFVL